MYKMFYNIVIWTGTYQCFCDLAKIIQISIEKLGYQCMISEKIFRDCCNLILGANACKNVALECNIPADSIIVQFEQLYDESPQCTKQYLDLLKEYEVWDYNETNVLWLKNTLGIDAKMLKIGYESSFEIPKIVGGDSAKDIDVLFYGALNDRRQKIQNELKTRFPNKNIQFHYNNLWGWARDELIARSKIVLNLHYYDAKLFEYPRVSYLLNSGAFVISETSANDCDYSFIKQGLVICSYSEICNAVERFLDPSSDETRRRISDTGYDLFKQQVSSVPLDKSDSDTPEFDSYKYRLWRKVMIYNNDYDDSMKELYEKAKECSTVCDFSGYDTVLSVWQIMKACVKTHCQLTVIREGLNVGVLSELREFINKLNIKVRITDDFDDSDSFDMVVFSGLNDEIISEWTSKINKVCYVFSLAEMELELQGFNRRFNGTFTVYERIEKVPDTSKDFDQDVIDKVFSDNCIIEDS